MRFPVAVLLATCLGLFAQPAQAQPTAPRQAPTEAAAGPPSWQFSLTPYAWLPALSGSLSTPLPRVGDRGFDIGSGTVLSNLDAIPVMVAGEARYGRFALVGDLFYAALNQDISTRDVLVQGGHTRVTSTVGTLLGMVRVIEEPRQSLELGAGTRIWDMRTKVSLNPGLLPGAIQKASASWADPLLAVRYGAMLSPRFGVTVYGDIGGFGAGSTLTWQAMGSLDYSLTDATVLRAGWRYLAVEKSRGSFSVDLGFNGPFVAATFRF